MNISWLSALLLASHPLPPDLSACLAGAASQAVRVEAPDPVVTRRINLGDWALCPGQPGGASGTLIKLPDNSHPLEVRLETPLSGNGVLALDVTLLDRRFQVLGRADYGRFRQRGSALSLRFFVNSPEESYLWIASAEAPPYDFREDLRRPLSDRALDLLGVVVGREQHLKLPLVEFGQFTLRLLPYEPKSLD